MTIARAWAEYRERVIPADASEVVVIDSRRAFYAGALSFLNTMQLGLDAVEEPDVDDERGVAVLKALHDELRAFGDAVVRGEA